MIWHRVSEMSPPQGKPVLAYYTNEETGEPKFDVLTFERELVDDVAAYNGEISYETWSRYDSVWDEQVVMQTLYDTVTHWGFLPDPPEDAGE